jgi:hypothetical protein
MVRNSNIQGIGIRVEIDLHHLRAFALRARRLPLDRGLLPSSVSTIDEKHASHPRGLVAPGSPDP